MLKSRAKSNQKGGEEKDEADARLGGHGLARDAENAATWCDARGPAHYATAQAVRAMVPRTRCEVAQAAPSGLGCHRRELSWPGSHGHGGDQAQDVLQEVTWRAGSRSSFEPPENDRGEHHAQKERCRIHVAH